MRDDIPVIQQHIRSDRRTASGLGRWVAVLGGLGMMALATRSRAGGGSRVLMALAGAALALRGAAGRRAPGAATDELPAPARRTAPTFPDPAVEDPVDSVDRASEDSFPASDPPGYTQIRASADGALGRRL